MMFLSATSCKVLHAKRVWTLGTSVSRDLASTTKLLIMKSREGCTTESRHFGTYSLMSVMSSSSDWYLMPTPLELQKYELNWIPRTTASLKSSMRKWQDCNFMHSVRSFHFCDISGLLREVSRVRGSPRTKIRAESSSNARELRSSGLTPQKSELSSHQIAPRGVVAHSRSWTPAAYEPHEVLLLRLFRLRQCDRRFKSTRPPVPCEVGRLSIPRS